MKFNLDGNTYEFTMERVTLKEAMAFQQKTGLTLLKLQQGLVEMDAHALQSLVWLVRWQNGERDLLLDDVDFTIGDLEVVDDDPPHDADDSSATPETPDQPTPATTPPDATTT